MKRPYPSVAISGAVLLALLALAGCGGGPNLFSSGSGTQATNPGGGTGNGNGNTGSGSTTVNPPPVVSSLSPASVVAGALPQTLTITGTGFNTSTTATFNGTNHLATYISATQISVVLTDGDLAVAAVAPVVVTNPTPGGGSSAPVNFLIDNPAPTISSFSPTAAPQGAAGQTLTIDGTGFVPQSSVTWDGTSRTTTFLSPTQLTISLAADDLATGGDVPVEIVNPSPGGGYSAPVNFPIDNPAPTLAQATPNSTMLSTDQVVTLTGTNFVPGATVSFAGGSGTDNLTPSAIAATQITVTVPGTLVTAAGTGYSLTVVNPAPGGGASGAAAFTVDYPAPALISMLPVSAPLNSPSPLTITLGGSGFSSAGTTATFNGSNHLVTYISPTQISIALNTADLAQSGIFPVTVSNPANPAPGGGSSNTLYFSVGEPTSSSAGIAVVSEEVQQLAGGPQTLDVAYLPLPAPPGGTQAEIDVVQLDTIDVPPFLPINGFVTNAAPYSTPGGSNSTFVNIPDTASSTAVLKRILLPAGYEPSATVADTADSQILISSIGSAQILTISTAVDPSMQTATAGYTLAGIGGSIEFSDYLCSGVCDLTVDQSGIGTHAGAWAMTPSGLIHFNEITGAALAPAFGSAVTPGPDFGYSSTNSSWNLLNPFYTEAGLPGLQFVNLSGAGAVTSLSNPVGTRPTSAVIDPGTQLAVVADEGTGVNTLLNLFQPPSGTSANVPSANFYLGSGGENCQTRPDWTMTALDAGTHLLLSAQMYAGCLAVTQMPTTPLTGSGSAATPTAPTQSHFGPVTAPQGPYQPNAPWGTISTELDPDAMTWSNGPDPYRFAVFTSVLTGKPTALLLEPQLDSNPSCVAAVPGVWLAEAPLPDMLNAANASGVGELTPTTMAELSAFIRVRVPAPAVCGPKQIAQGTTVTQVTFTGAGFVSGTTIDWDGTPLAILSQTPTSITVNLSPEQMTLGTHTVTVSTDATTYGSIGGTSQFTATVVPGS